jgi:hypothetical protein
MESRRPWIQAGSWMGPAHMGPPIWKPLPVSGHACGTAGPAPGPYLVLLPFTNYARHRIDSLSNAGNDQIGTWGTRLGCCMCSSRSQATCMAPNTPLTHTPAVLHIGTVGPVQGPCLVLFMFRKCPNADSTSLKMGTLWKVTATAAREMLQAPTILSHSNTCQESACQSRLTPRLPDSADADVIVGQGKRMHR